MRTFQMRTFQIRKMKGFVGLSLLAFLCFFLLFDVSPSADMQAQFSWRPLRDTVYQGEEACQSLFLSNTQPLDSFSFVLHYDTALFSLSRTETEAAELLSDSEKKDGRAFVFRVPAAAEEQRELVRFFFKPKATGYSDLQLSDAEVSVNGARAGVTPLAVTGLYAKAGVRPASETGGNLRPGDLGNFAFSDPDPDQLQAGMPGDSDKAEEEAPAAEEAHLLGRGANKQVAVALVSALAAFIVLLSVLVKGAKQRKRQRERARRSRDAARRRAAEKKVPLRRPKSLPPEEGTAGQRASKNPTKDTKKR